MAEKPLVQQISLGIQNFIYKVADDLTTVVDEALEAFEDAAASFEKEVTPTYTLNVHGEVDPERVKTIAANVVSDLNTHAQRAPSKTGGRDETGTPLSREQLLREVYRYVAANTTRYVDWAREYEDANATATGHEVWITNQLVDEFARVVKEENDVLDPPNE